MLVDDTLDGVAIFFEFQIKLNPIRLVFSLSGLIRKFVTFAGMQLNVSFARIQLFQNLIRVVIDDW